MKKTLTKYEIEQMYDEMLSDVYGEVEICGLKYDAADAFKRLDPIAYRCGFADYWSMLIDDGYTKTEDGGLTLEDETESA